MADRGLRKVLRFSGDTSAAACHDEAKLLVSKSDHDADPGLVVYDELVAVMSLTDCCSPDEPGRTWLSAHQSVKKRIDRVE